MKKKSGEKYSNTWVGGQDIPEHGNGLALAYYSSGAISWIDSALYSYNNIDETFASNSFLLFPNPATDEITITADAGNHAPFDAYIYDVAGNLLDTHKIISANMFNLSVKHLTPPVTTCLSLLTGRPFRFQRFYHRPLMLEWHFTV